MITIPAVDLKEGRCVRLLKGQRDEETEYHENPVEMAKHWEEEGADRLHLVDLDGAFDGDSENKSIIREILKTLTIPCQVGGGIRDAQAIEQILDAGADAAIIGTAGVSRPSWLRQMVNEFGSDKVFAGVDCRDGNVVVKGWEETSAFSLLEWTQRLENIGIETIIYTDVGRDGAQVGPDYTGTEKLLEQSNMNVIASGGVGELEHLQKFESIHSDQLLGVIVGRALYEQNFTFGEAREALQFEHNPV